jgi:hypothetical protein
MARSGLTCGLLRPSLKVLGVRSQADLATGRPGWDCWMTVNGANRKHMVSRPDFRCAPIAAIYVIAIGPPDWSSAISVGPPQGNCSRLDPAICTLGSFAAIGIEVGAGHPAISNAVVNNSTIRAGPRWRRAVIDRLEIHPFRV